MLANNNLLKSLKFSDVYKRSSKTVAHPDKLGN